MFKWIFLCFNLCLCLLSTASLRRAWLHLISPYQVFIQVGKIPPSPLFSTVSSPSSLRLSLYDSCSIPLIMFAGLQTFLKAQNNISSPWQLFLSPWRSSNFYGQCNCRGECTCVWIDFHSAFAPLALAHYHCLWSFYLLSVWSELWALPIQDIGYLLQFPDDGSPWPLLASCHSRKVRVALNSLPRHVPSGTWSCCSFLS